MRPLLDRIPSKSIILFHKGVIHNHKPRGQFFGYFWPPPPSWSLLLNKVYVIKWSLANPLSSLTVHVIYVVYGWPHIRQDFGICNKDTTRDVMHKVTYINVYFIRNSSVNSTGLLVFCMSQSSKKLAIVEKCHQSCHRSHIHTVFFCHSYYTNTTSHQPKVDIRNADPTNVFHAKFLRI